MKPQIASHHAKFTALVKHSSAPWSITRSTCDMKVGRQWAQQREIRDTRGQQPGKWEPKHGYILSMLASYKEIVRSPKSGGKHGSKLFLPDLLSGFWYCLMTTEGQITTFRQGNKGQLTHAKCCSLDGSPHTSEIS